MSLTFKKPVFAAVEGPKKHHVAVTISDAQMAKMEAFMARKGFSTKADALRVMIDLMEDVE